MKKEIKTIKDLLIFIGGVTSLGAIIGFFPCFYYCLCSGITGPNSLAEKGIYTLLFFTGAFLLIGILIGTTLYIFSREAIKKEIIEKENEDLKSQVVIILTSNDDRKSERLCRLLLNKNVNQEIRNIIKNYKYLLDDTLSSQLKKHDFEGCKYTLSLLMGVTDENKYEDLFEKLDEYDKQKEKRNLNNLL